MLFGNLQRSRTPARVLPVWWMLVHSMLIWIYILGSSSFSGWHQCNWLHHLEGFTKYCYTTLRYMSNVGLCYTMCSMQSDISRLEAKIERMDAQLAAKDRELATLTRTVCPVSTPVWILNHFWNYNPQSTTIIRRPKILQLWKLRLRSCSRNVTNFKKWLLEIRLNILILILFSF
jgi:hypothetical protein